MKKFFALLAVSLFLISACGTEPVATTTPAATDTSMRDATKKTAPTTTATSPVTATKTQVFTIEAGSFYFKPNALTVKVNQPVTLRFKSSGTHNFSLAEFGVDVDLSGEAGEVTFTPTKTGTFQFFCNVGRHRQIGQVGTMTVTE